MIRIAWMGVAAATMLTLSDGAAQPAACAERGSLDTAFCDADRDLVADMPVDRTRWRNPALVTISSWPEEDLSLSVRAMQPLIDHLTRCANKRIALVQTVTPSAQIEALRAGRLHLTIVRPDRMPAAVNVAGAVPFAVLGSATGALSKRVQIVVRGDSGIDTLGGLRGRMVAHLSTGDLAGDLVLRGLLPQQGILPGRDYRIARVANESEGLAAMNAGTVQASVAGISAAAPVAATASGGRAIPLRRLWESPPIPSAGLVHAHDLVPALRDRLVQCMRDFRFTVEMSELFGDADRVFPATYARDWEAIRTIANAVDLPRTRAAHDAELKANAPLTSGDNSIVAPSTR